jgi:hypothetical protein
MAHLPDSGHKEATERAISRAEEVLGLFEAERPEDLRPREAIEAARKWLRGEIRCGAAREAAFRAHAAAREADGPAAVAAARSAGHAAATAHVAKHSLSAESYARKALDSAGVSASGLRS